MKSKIEREHFRLTMKTFLDQNAIYLTALSVPREVRCYVCKSATEEVSIYLNHNSLGEALILCRRCHEDYQTPHQKKTAGV